MRTLASERLGGRLEGIHALAGEELDSLQARANAAISCAAFHLMAEDRVLPALSRALMPGSKIAVNYWCHSLAEYQHLERAEGWKQALPQAASELGVALELPEPTGRRVRSLEELEACARQAGLSQRALEPDLDTVSAALSIDFATTSPALQAQLQRLGPSTGQALLQRAQEICPEDDMYASCRIIWELEE